MSDRYPAEVLGEMEDDGTIEGNVDELRDLVVGHRIVRAENAPVTKSDFTYTDGLRPWTDFDGFILTLDNGRRVALIGGTDCCAYTELEAFLLHPERVDHVITGVGTTDGYQRWHIYADMGDVLEMTVGWGPGNAFYYAYGFSIAVSDVIDADPKQQTLPEGQQP